MRGAAARARVSLSRSHADKKTFPQLDVVGWYSTGAALLPEDKELQKEASGRATLACAPSHRARSGPR